MPANPSIPKRDMCNSVEAQFNAAKLAGTRRSITLDYHTRWTMAIFAHSKASTTTKLIFIAAALYVNRDGEFHISTRSLAALAGVNKDTVTESLKELRELGEIFKIGESIRNQSGTQYRINLPKATRRTLSKKLKSS
jgi:uncharacterized protein YbgA (DUF1722 family)